VIDVSSAGVLAESAARLLPNTHVEIHVTTHAGRALVRSRVVRVWVHALSVDAIVYHAAFAFDRSLDIRSVDARPSGYLIPAGPE
jgi:hypothetical protein